MAGHQSLLDKNLTMALIDKDLTMDETVQKIIFLDNGGRRSGVDRRQFSYTSYIPERRRGGDRRKGEDRRKMARIVSQIK